MEKLKVVINWAHPRGYVEEVIREDGTRWIVEGQCYQCGKCCTIVPLVYRAPGVSVCPQLKYENNKAVCMVQ